MTFNIQEEEFSIRLEINQNTGKTTIRYNGKKIRFSPQKQVGTDSQSIFHFQIGKGAEVQYFEIDYSCQNNEIMYTHRVTCKMNGAPFFYQMLNEKHPE